MCLAHGEHRTGIARFHFQPQGTPRVIGVGGSEPVGPRQMPARKKEEGLRAAAPAEAIPEVMFAPVDRHSDPPLDHLALLPTRSTRSSGPNQSSHNPRPGDINKRTLLFVTPILSSFYLPYTPKSFKINSLPNYYCIFISETCLHLPFLLTFKILRVFTLGFRKLIRP